MTEAEPDLLHMAINLATNLTILAGVVLAAGMADKDIRRDIIGLIKKRLMERRSGRQRPRP
jgi:hypothetical protein